MVGSNGWTRRVCDGLGGLFLFFLKFFPFDLPRRATNYLGKYHIYYDLSSEEVGLPASVKPFCPPPLIFL